MVNDNEHPNDPAGGDTALGSFPARLGQLIGTSSVRAFARKAGVSDTFLRQCLAGRTEPTRTKLIALAGAGDTNVEWLATGRGARSITADAAEGGAALLDHALLELVIRSLDEALGDPGRTLSPGRRAVLISNLYAMYSGRGHEPLTREEILDLVERTS